MWWPGGGVVWVGSDFNIELQYIAASYTGAKKRDEKGHLVHTVWTCT